MSAKLVQRVLDWLGKYPPALEKAWDVPRSICLPGIAEGLGVSRSALHAPLSKLLNDGLILERRAHVLNAGTRRRKVRLVIGLNLPSPFILWRVLRNAKGGSSEAISSSQTGGC